MYSFLSFSLSFSFSLSSPLPLSLSFFFQGLLYLRLVSGLMWLCGGLNESIPHRLRYLQLVPVGGAL